MKPMLFGDYRSLMTFLKSLDNNAEIWFKTLPEGFQVGVKQK